MGLAHSLGRLVRRAFPGFPEHHVLRDGVVLAIADPPADEQDSDLFRPRYAVDVQLLTPAGEPDTAHPVLEGLALPALACGPGRGIYGFPAPGTRVLIAYAYGLPSHPRIIQTYPVGQPLPELGPEDVLLQHSDGNFLRFDAKGNYAVQTDGELREDSHLRSIEADESTETLGQATRTVTGDCADTVEGSLRQQVLGALLQVVAGDARAVVLGSAERAVLGDENALTAGSFERTAGLGYRLLTVPGVGSIAIGNGVVELLAMLDAILTAMQAETHPETGATTGVPSNASDYLTQQELLAALKE